jgi:hypothetical protein
MFFIFLFADSEVKGEFRGPLSSGEAVMVEVDREVITAAPVIADSPVVIAICPVGELFPEAVHPDQVEVPSEVWPLITEVEAPHLPNLGEEVTPSVLSGTGRPSPIPAGSSRSQRTRKPISVMQVNPRLKTYVSTSPLSGTGRPSPIPAGSGKSQRTRKPISVMQVNPRLKTYLLTSPKF